MERRSNCNKKKTKFNVTQQILSIPPVLSVSCGYEHTLIITTDSNLCDNYVLEVKKINQNFTKHHFQKYQLVIFIHYFKTTKGEIFACGYNHHSQCGLDHFNSSQITPSLILNAPPKIVQFFSGHHRQSLILCG